MVATDGLRLPPKLVLFDLDDTLCDHYYAHRLRLRRAFTSAVEDRPEIDVEALVEQAAAQLGGTGHFAELLRAAGVEDDACHELAVAIYSSDRLLGLELYPESLEVVAAVSRHAPVGLITNGPSGIQREKIRRLALEAHFPVILVSEEEGVWKPDREIFARALARAGGIRPEDAVYVGDSPEHDIAGAQAAGLMTVWVNRRERAWPEAPRPDFEIHDLRELPAVLGFEVADAAGAAGEARPGGRDAQ